MYLNPTSGTYDALLLSYKFMNEHLFDGVLPICLITLQREKKTYGYFCGSRFQSTDDSSKRTDEIALNPQFFRSNGRDDRAVCSTLVHEMCHLWQHHYGKPGRARYHNQQWADKMKKIGLIPSSTGQIGGKETGDCMSHYIDERGPFAAAYRDLVVQGFALQWIEPPEYEIIEKMLPDPDNPQRSVSLTDIEDDEEIRSIIEKPRKKDSSKMKYSCPLCGLNAWAKFGAHFICGTCNTQMLNQDVDLKSLLD
ncbi:MAG: SprT-like domain-containing protein [Spirochaetes bacterium]|nr:SprT-like domain-containing protein [Spirochaetota bacterium]